MNVALEYGQGTVNVTLPDTADIFIPGETVPDPPYIPEDQLEEKTLESLRNPMGMEPLSKLAHKGSKVTIVFPDRVKGGEQPTSHRKISIKLILKELYDAGVEKKDILLICSNGLHRKNTEKEIRAVLGNELFHEFWFSHQIINHDSEDYDHLVDLGTTDRGDPVLMTNTCTTVMWRFSSGTPRETHTAAIPAAISIVPQESPIGVPLPLTMCRRSCTGQISLL